MSVSRLEPHTVQIERHGLTWSGSWSLENETLVVTSAYGSRTRPVSGAEDLDGMAQAVMDTIVFAWRKRKA